MTKTFYSWYKKYVSNCNSKYIVFVEELIKKIEVNKIQLQKLVDVRIRCSDLSQENDLDQKFSTYSNELANLELKLEKSKSIRHEMDERLLENSAKKVYDKIIDHPKIQKITADENALNIYTKELKVEGQSIGNFKLTYQLDNKLYIRNLEFVVDDQYDHWHIHYGEPCLSQWYPILWRQLDTFQLFFFVDTLIHYLLLSDSVHAYMPFQTWIEKFKAKKKVDKQPVKQTGLTANQQAYLNEYSYQTIQASTISTGWSWSSSTSTGTGTYSYWHTV